MAHKVDCGGYVEERPGGKAIAMKKALDVVLYWNWLLAVGPIDDLTMLALDTTKLEHV